MPLRSRRTITKFKTYLTVINVSRFVWLLIIWTSEVGMFRVVVSHCKWPTQLTHGFSENPTHVLLIADPQILDLNSYPNRPLWLKIITQYIVDLNLRKSWNAVISKLNPDLLIFLGDMMDNGRSVNDYEFSQYYSRFKSIFKFPQPIPVHYIPGNHDVGLGPFVDAPIKTHLRSRYLTTFGPFNRDFKVANHTFLLIDAPSLVDEFELAAGVSESQHGDVDWPSIQGGTIEFLQDFYKTRQSDPIVLFSHIPLARSNFTAGSCGPFRENVRPILPGRGQSYQNLLPKEVTLYLLNDIRPSVIFSGDDHDYCDYRHELLDQSEVHEVSVRSFSMAMGIKRPGFQLLSIALPPQYQHQPEPESVISNSSELENPIAPPSFPSTSPPSANFAYKPCLLPNQINIYIFQYGFSALFTIAILCAVNYNRHRRYTKQLSRRLRLFREPSDDDDDDEAKPPILYPGGFLGGLTQRSTGAGADDEGIISMRSLQKESALHRPQLTLPLHFTTSSHHIHYEWSPTQKNYRRKRRKWYIQVLWDLIHICWLPLLFYILISYWYFL